jgi:hypothetical protein
MTRSGQALISRFCTVDSAPNQRWFVSRQLRVLEDNRIRAHVKAPIRLLSLLCSGILLVGCGVARTSYHVVTAPVRLVTHHSDKPSDATTTTTTTSSDVTAPGRPVPPPSPTPTRRRVATEQVASSSASPSPQATRKQSVEANAKPSSAAPVEFPTAKPVPGKPGYVFDPFNPNGGYIDVSGYPPGSKVRDPATQRIFVVP